MKKITLIWLTLLTLTLTACGWNSSQTATWWSSSSVGKLEWYKTKLYTCNSENLKWWCSETDNEDIWIFKATNKLCSLVNIKDKDEVKEKLQDFLKDGVKAKLELFRVDPATHIVKLIASTKKINNYTDNNSPKNIDILFDLTYYSTDNKDLENEVITERKKKLEEELLNSLNPGDKVTLRYIWTIDYGTYPEHKNAVLKDVDEFQLKWENTSKIEKKYYVLNFRCKVNKRLKSVKLYTNIDTKKKLNMKINNNKTEIATYNTKQDLISAIENKIDTKYNSWKYSYGTYFLETLSNYEDFLNRKDYTKNDLNIIVSDFRFQLHPIMKKRKNIPENVNFSFPPEKLSLWKKWTIYYNFYTKTIPSYFTDRCKHNEKLDLVWLETDDIEIKKIMKDYYKNYLFKKCNVEFK